MKIFFLVLINKLVTFFCKLIGKNGGQWPGHIIYDWLDKKALTYVKYPKYVIAVTGSAGKGSTCSLIKHTLDDAGYKVAFNETGDNGVLGVTTTILNHCKLNGHMDCDVLLLECDERHLKLIFTKNKPTHLVIINLTRDQPTRNGNPIIVLNDIKKIITDDMELIINVDDPLVNRFKDIHHGKITTYGIAHISGDIKKPRLENVDFAYCPKCHKKLSYAYYHYGHLGLYSCKNNDFERGIPDFEASKVNLNKKELVIENTKINLDKNVIYAAYAATAAYTTLRTIGVSKESIAYALNKDTKEAKRGKSLEYKNHIITMLETKNENNLSYYQSCRYIKEQSGIKGVVLGFDYVSRRYKESDLSWLYDIDFELLNDESIDKIFLIGRFKYDLATRLSYANIDPKKIILVNDTKELLNYLKEYKHQNIYTMVWTDVIKELKTMIKDEENEN